MSARRLWVLVSRLPQDSHTARLLHGESADWSMEAALLARIGNLIIQTHSSKRVPESKLLLPPSARKRARQQDGKPKPKPEKAGGWRELDALFGGGKEG